MDGTGRRQPVQVMDQAIMDTTVRIINEIPGAIADQVKKGNYSLKIESSVTGPNQPPATVTPPPTPVQPPPAPQRRWILPRQ